MTEKENSAMLQKMYDFIDASYEDMVELLVKLAEIESPSSYKEGVDRVCNEIKRFCEDNGIQTKVYEYPNAGNSFTAIINKDSGKKEIALMGHMDTVHPVGAFGESTVMIEDGYIHGPGVYDCKGGLVIALYTILALKKFGYRDRPVKLIFSGDEEVGHRDSDGAEVFCEDADIMEAALNCESGMLDGRVAVGRKGGIGMRMVIEGVAAHAGNNPQDGRSAIKEAAYKIIEIEKHTDYEGTTFNCGLISGGTVPNQIPDHCEFSIDCRIKTEEAGRDAVRLMQSIADRVYVDGTKTTLIVPSRIGKPMEANEANMALFERYREASRVAGAIEPRAFFSGGGSDASITSGAGVPSICTLGIMGADNHSLRERALLSSLKERSKVLLALILNFDRKQHDKI